MRYNMPLFRPPSEANSLIIQATLGCSHNKCTFCNMYKGKKFTIKSFQELKEEIDYIRKNIDWKSVNRIFLADGDSLIIKFSELKKTLNYIKESFPNCKRISMYASPKSIELKTIEELKELKSLGVFMVYLGLESGDDEILRMVKKGATSEEILKCGKKVKESGIKLSVTAIAGLGGLEKTYQHRVNTGKVISEMAPEYFSILTLMYDKNTEIYEEIFNKKFTILENYEVLDEINGIIKNIHSNSPIIFRCNHASNYVMLEGTLPKDKEKILKNISSSLENGEFIKDYSRRL